MMSKSPNFESIRKFDNIRKRGNIDAESTIRGFFSRNLKTHKLGTHGHMGKHFGGTEAQMQRYDLSRKISWPNY